MKIEKVTWYSVPDLWPQVSPWISAALAHGGGGYTLSDIYENLLSRQMQLWQITDGSSLLAVAVTQAWMQPRVRVFDILAVGGRNVAAWEHLIDDLVSYAQSKGFDEVRAHGRLGWHKQAERYGFDLLHAVYRKKLR